jgi:hypothetical protein
LRDICWGSGIKACFAFIPLTPISQSHALFRFLLPWSQKALIAATPAQLFLAKLNCKKPIISVTKSAAVAG